MECPVCYDCEAQCDFVCGHSFCYQCVKTWYQKGTSTCPMCRRGMCFRGVIDAKKVWNREKRERLLEDVVEELFLDMEDYDDYEYGVDMLEIMYDRFNTIIETFPYIDEDTFWFILQNPWITIDEQKVYGFHEVPTYMRYLMVSKTAYGVKRTLGPRRNYKFRFCNILPK